MRVYVGCPHQLGTDRKCCTNLFQRKNGRPRLRKGSRRPNTPPLLLSVAFFPEGWEGPCPQKEVMVRFGGQPNWLQNKFYDQENILWSDGSGKHFASSTSKQRLFAQILAAYRPGTKKRQFIFHLPVQLNPGSAIHTFISISPHLKATDFYSSQLGDK